MRDMSLHVENAHFLLFHYGFLFAGEGERTAANRRKKRREVLRDDV
jgi:hypothetical protein